MRILIAVPNQNRATGNWVTARRFRHGLERYGHVMTLCETSLDPAPLARAVAEFAPDVAVLLHAFRSGFPWLKASAESRVPSLVVLTGTDVHQGMSDLEEGPLIEQVFRQTAAIVTQNRLTFEALRQQRPDLAGRLHYLAPGVELGREPYPLRRLHAIPADSFLFLCPASLRPVKGVLELLSLFDPLAQRRGDFHLACCGPVLDAGYGERVLAAVAERPWASHLGIIPAAAMASAMSAADAVVNNSASEGLPNALLEAVALGRPVLARNIPGNAAVIQPGINGLLYDNADEFLPAAESLIDHSATLAVRHPSREAFNTDREAAELDRLCRQLLAASA